MNRVVACALLLALLGATVPLERELKKSAPPQPTRGIGLGKLGGSVLTGVMRPLLLYYLWVRVDGLTAHGAAGVGGAPLVIAHRGAAAEAPENTIEAFDLSVFLGADALELDVQQAGDGTLVVIHDSTVDRTTEADGPVAGFGGAELERLGVCALITKPWDDAKLKATLRRALDG